MLNSDVEEDAICSLKCWKSANCAYGIVHISVLKEFLYDQSITFQIQE